MSVIRAEQLCEREGDAIAVDSLGLKVDRGEGCGHLAANGAGKTTIRMAGISAAASAAAIVALERRDLLGV
jgi:ABC-type multidrug transport system ATPase subunit